MIPTLRWFGPTDPVTLDDVRQAGAHGVVTALHSVPNGRVWSRAAIERRVAEIESAGMSESGRALEWNVVESVPVHESIKRGGPDRDLYIDAYAKTVSNLGAAGIGVVCYNFMPVLDWTRTDLAWPLPTGALALRFDRTQFDAFDLFDLQRPGASTELSEERVERAAEAHAAMTEDEHAALRDAIIAGLPGAEESYSMGQLHAELDAYRDIDEAALRSNLLYFLEPVVAAAKAAGVRLALHPDDPPWPLLGLPRIASTAEHYRLIFEAVPSEANGMTFCSGSFGACPANDLGSIVAEFRRRIQFVHLRNVELEADGSFHETLHLSGVANMKKLLGLLAAESAARSEVIPYRPDHGVATRVDQLHQARPGYPYVGRLRGIAELRGLLAAL